MRHRAIACVKNRYTFVTISTSNFLAYPLRDTRIGACCKCVQSVAFVAEMSCKCCNSRKCSQINGLSETGKWNFSSVLNRFIPDYARIACENPESQWLLLRSSLLSSWSDSWPSFNPFAGSLAGCNGAPTRLTCALLAYG